MNTTPIVDCLRQAFDYYNALIFGSRLPVPKLKWSYSKTRLGQMTCKRKMDSGRTTYYDYCISVSSYYQLTLEEIDDVLIHEMIHYTIAYTGLKDTSPHGIVFRGMMDKINRTFDRHITISMRTRNLQPRIAQQTKKFLILAIEMKDGKYFLSSVNPSFARKLSLFLARMHEIAHYAWYQSQDEYFHNMPCVRSLRGKQVSKEVYTTMIEKMKRLK